MFGRTECDPQEENARFISLCVVWPSFVKLGGMVREKIIKNDAQWCALVRANRRSSVQHVARQELS